MVPMFIRQIANLTFGNNTFDASNKNVQKTVHTFCGAKDEKNPLQIIFEKLQRKRTREN